MPDQFDAYMKLKGINGECLDAEFEGKNVCELITLSIDPSSQTFTISKPTDTATPALHKNYCLNFSKNDADQAEIPCARIWVRKDCGMNATSALTSQASKKFPAAAYIVFEFTKVAVKSFDWSLAETGEATDDVTFSFATCFVKYRPQLKGGALGTWVEGSWDFDKDVKGAAEKGDAGVF